MIRICENITRVTHVWLCPDSFPYPLSYMLPGKVCGDVIPSEGEKWKIEERKKR
jgi:hypothetical protein